MRFLYFCCALLLFGHGYASVVPCQEICQYIAQHLSQSGTLKQSKSGYVYLDISEEYICKLNPLIIQSGYLEPPLCPRISVISSSEADRYQIGSIEKVGSSVTFCIQNCQIVQRGGDPSIESYYILAVNSPELAKIREEHGLPPAFFYITIGIKYVAYDEEIGEPQALDESM